MFDVTLANMFLLFFVVFFLICLHIVSI